VGCNWKVYITRHQLWAKPRPTFKPEGGVLSCLLDVCSMFARSCKQGVNQPRAADHSVYVVILRAICSMFYVFVKKYS